MGALMKFTTESIQESKYKSEICELLEMKSPTEIIRRWVNEARRIVVMSGEDDTTGEKRVYLLFEADEGCGEPLAVAYCSETTALAADPMVKELIPPPFTRTKFNFENPDELAPEEDAYFKKSDEYLVGDFDEELLSEICPFERTVVASIAVALSGRGETTFNVIPPTFLEESESPETYLEDYFYIHGILANETKTILQHFTWYARGRAGCVR